MSLRGVLERNLKEVGKCRKLGEVCGVQYRVFSNLAGHFIRLKELPLYKKNPKEPFQRRKDFHHLLQDQQDRSGKIAAQGTLEAALVRTVFVDVLRARFQ